MTQAELCRQKAIECEQEAKRTPSSFEAEAWLKLAKQWRELAERIEKYSRWVSDLLNNLSYGTAARFALKSAFGMTGLHGFRLKVCEPHWYVARRAYGVPELW
jgi:hypothetical protein